MNTHIFLNGFSFYPFYYYSTCIWCWLHFPSKVESSLHWWKFLRTPFNLLPDVQISYGCIQSSTLGSLSVIVEKKKLLCRTCYLNFCFRREKQNNSLGHILLVKKNTKVGFFALWWYIFKVLFRRQKWDKMK